MGKCVGIALVLVLVLAGSAGGQENYTFEPSEYQKKAFEIGGYVEPKFEGFSFDRDSAFYQLDHPNGNQAGTNERGTATFELSGKYRKDVLTFGLTVHGDARRDVVNGNSHEIKIYEGGLSLQPTTGLVFDLGKKLLQWGKGYAWNPIGFAQRPKDPTDPGLSREGFWMARADYVHSFQGPVQTVGLTLAAIPVSRSLNSNFGKSGHTNVAGKLYLLAKDTDLDFAVLGGGSKSMRYGADFSRNLGSNMEVHGEIAWISATQRPVVDSTGKPTQVTGSALSYLLGLRYLTGQDTTYILEYYRNGPGFRRQEEQAFFSLAHEGVEQFRSTGNQVLLKKAEAVSGMYAGLSTMRHYLYLKISQNEPFNIVYFVPSLTIIANVDDHSMLILPELLYTGIKNLELRFRIQANLGPRMTDFGEKEASKRVEFRLRYYF